MSFRNLAGGGAACAYCGFCVVVEGPRQCCRAGADYDALRAENEDLRQNDKRYRWLTGVASRAEALLLIALDDPDRRIDAALAKEPSATDSASGVTNE